MCFSTIARSIITFQHGAKIFSFRSSSSSSSSLTCRVKLSRSKFFFSTVAMASSSPSAAPLLAKSPEVSAPLTDPDTSNPPINMPADESSAAPVESSLVNPPLDGDHPEHGFRRPEMYTTALAGTVQLYERHFFLCCKDSSSWPPYVEAPEFDPLSRLLFAAFKARKNEMPWKSRLTICEGRDGSGFSDGDVLIFPDMVAYKGLNHVDVDTFVDEVLIQGKEWASGSPERLVGAHVFVCSHGSRDARCGACGPALIQSFKEEIVARGLEGQVSVMGCSHIGGHKYAGNVIIYNMNRNGKVGGHWFGYVTPEDVPVLMDEHINQGKIIGRLWRGQMGMTQEEQKQVLSRLESNPADLGLRNGCPCSTVEENVNGLQDEGIMKRCCQEGGKSDKQKAEKSRKDSDKKEGLQKNKLNSGWGRVSSWFEDWEKEDTIAALAVVSAAAAVAVAYHLYRNSSSN